MVHLVERALLHIEPDCFIIQETDASLKAEILKISFDNGMNTDHFKKLDSYTPSADKLASFVIYGIIGSIILHQGLYLILIVERKIVGSIFESGIYRLVDTAIIPLDAIKALRVLVSANAVFVIQKTSKTNSSVSVEAILQKIRPSTKLTTKLAKIALSATTSITSKMTNTLSPETIDAILVDDLESVLCDQNMYFSYRYDITNTMQRMWTSNKSATLWHKCDRRFWWNEYLQFQLVVSKAHAWLLPITQGFVQIENAVINDQPFKFCLISRRSRERSGLRYERRGLDENGSCANFVETEQILVNDDQLVSFAITRGSIPLYWSQSGTSLKPVPTLLKNGQDNFDAMKLHFVKQKEYFPFQLIVNLVESQGREAIVGNEYEKNVSLLNDPSIIYYAFDFHKKCKGLKYENGVEVVKDLKPFTLKYQMLFWKHVAKSAPFSQQEAVFRVNCMDCLDRTNVCQSMLAREMMISCLLKLAIVNDAEKPLESYKDLDFVFNSVWANHGDAISKIYTGTNALKGDYTRKVNYKD